MAFQVKIHVIEARKLEGNNINPLIKVSCGDESQKTSTRRGTNSPVFDETLIFNFKERPVELFEKKLEIKVMSTGKKLRDCALGFFSLEIGAIYYEPKHTFHHKWLLLTDADDPSLGAKGFLKATLSVLGPDDDPVTSNYEVSPDYVDIESNLLRPSGVRLQEATLSVKLYSAEDLPQMDPEYFEKFKSFFHLGTGKKELVDPFATLSYAGHKVDSEVKWNTQNPEWNEQLNIGYRFPSICERVRIELKDKDKLNADDFIGTCIINIPEISAPGDNGFLPTLGPCFINVYGSPREYTDLPDKYDHLNKGLCEGVAYRGRVLIEISTSLDGMPKEKKEMMSLSEIRKLQPFQRRQRYVLFAVFMSASMLYADRSDQISFEISIGNYGYSGDKTVVAQSSTTQSACPKYDGRNYSYMPWGHRKPLVLLESFWENCQYRIESMNLFINITDRLVLQILDKYLHKYSYSYYYYYICEITLYSYIKTTLIYSTFIIIQFIFVQIVSEVIFDSKYRKMD
jgi:dysferlin